MRLHGIPPIVRAAGSLALILIGAFLLGLVWLPSDDDGDNNAAADPSPTPRPSCADGLQPFDNTALHFKICVPPTLVYYDGNRTESLGSVDQRSQRFAENFFLVNLAWINTWTADLPEEPAVAPLSVRVELVDQDATFNGCNVRTMPANEQGVRECSDTYTLIDGQVVAADDGFIHIYKALVPTTFVPPGSAPSMGDGWSLLVTVDSPTDAWERQQPLVAQIVESIQPY